MLNSFVVDFLTVVSLLAVAFLVLLVGFAITLYCIDTTQTKSSIRRNYPVMGRFRYFFEHAGIFFRQYFFSMDREELPFNRALRSWVYRAAKGVPTTIAFGSTRSMLTPGEPHFLNAPFPPIDEEIEPSPAMTFGPNCPKPYTTSSYFNISGMSFGAISKPAVMALSEGAAKSGCWLNTGEGGLSPYHLQNPNADIVFQIGTAKFGVRNQDGQLSDERLKNIAEHDQVKMFELKLSQGAKPGKGGILPAEKVTEEIAKIRGVPVGKSAISPNRHPEIADNKSLLAYLSHIRDVTGKPVGFKFVMGDPGWIVQLSQCILEMGKSFAPDFITLDSADGGTGAAPQPLMDYMGLPITESLPILVDTLENFGLRDAIRIVVSGKNITPSFVARTLAYGSDVVVSARGFMFALGCIQALQCNKNTCPTGVTTHNKKLQRGLDPMNKGQRVANYQKNMIKEVEMIAHACGVKHAKALNRGHLRVVLPSGHSTDLQAHYASQTRHHSHTL